MAKSDYLNSDDFKAYERLKLLSQENLHKMGSEEMKVLINCEDIKNFLDKNNLYVIIESNYI